MRIPVADDQAVEAHLLLDHLGQKMAAAVDLLAANAGEGGHDRLHARFDRWRIAGAVDVAKLPGRGQVIALVLAAIGAAVAHEMLGRGDHLAGAEEAGRAAAALEAGHHLPGIGADDLRVF